MATYASKYGKDRSRTCYWPRREDKRKRAQALLVERATRTPFEQLQHLDQLLGSGLGALKERLRLLSTLSIEEIKSYTGE